MYCRFIYWLGLRLAMVVPFYLLFGTNLGKVVPFYLLFGTNLGEGSAILSIVWY